ncbi:CIC11C00000004201 [Sungouiella intermedia]|nr:CIC11C00000004201 [[Candida] intermedia]
MAGTEVFVGNLPFSVTWQTLKDLMRSAGDVVRADIKQNKWGRSRGFGTVVFNTPEEAAAAVEKFQGYNLEGRQIDIRPGRDLSKKDRDIPFHKNTPFTEGVTGNGPESAVIFAGNLPYITTESDLFELFETIGHVNKAEIKYNEQGRASGNAVVEFELVDLAASAIQNLHGYNYGGRDLLITFAKRGSGDSVDIAVDGEDAIVDAAEDAPIDVAAEAAQEIEADPVVEQEPAVEADVDMN